MKPIQFLLAGVLAFAASSAATFASASERFESFQYRNVGPARGGRVTAVAGTVAERGTFYLGASGGGVWKTTDYGTTWQNVSDGFFDTPSIGDIAIARNDANIVYVGTGSDGLRSNVITGNGVYRSVNGGSSWEHMGLEETGHIGAVEIDPRDNGTVWVAAIGQAFNDNAQRGLYRTTDGGASWEQMLFISESVGISDVELLPGNPQVVFATAWKARRKPWTIISGGEHEEGGLYKSVDGGQSWTRITEGLPTGLIGKIDLAISPADSSIVYALVEAPGDEGGLYRSEDQGASFKQVSSKDYIRTRPFYYANIDVDPSNPDIVYSMATRYYKSVDGGKNWERLTPPHGDNHDMWINPEDPDLFIQANDGGANVTHNGGKSWSTQFNQPTTELYQVEVDDQYPYWLYGGQQDNSTTIAVPSQAPYRVQNPAAWLIETGGCETGPAVPKPGDANIVYANCKGRFGRFDKRTGTEQGYYVGAANMYGHNPRDLRYRFQRVSPIHVSPHDPSVVYHASQFVHRTTDEGVTWETISPDLTAFEADKQVISGSPITRDITGEEFYSTIYSLRESPVQAGVIWVGANDGPVHVTRDNGSTWTDVTPAQLPPGGRVDAVAPSPHDAAVAYIAVHRYLLADWQPYILKTEDYGASWTLLTDGDNGIPADEPTRVVREDPVRPGLLFAGTEKGLYVSLNDGAQWLPFQQNLPITPVSDLQVVRGDLAISTMGRAFWVLDNITTLRQESFHSVQEATGGDATLFAPPETIRFRQRFENRDADAVPQYPRPAVVIDYYLPEAPRAGIQLDILDDSGAVVSSYRSKGSGEESEDSADSSDGREAMAANIREDDAVYLETEKLTTRPGFNRFRWDMAHAGAWHKDEKQRFRYGPMAAPGSYQVRLTVGEKQLEQRFTLRTDPRVTAAGLSDAVIAEQVAFELDTLALLSSARRTAHRLAEEKSALEERVDAGETLPDAEQARLEAIERSHGKLVTAEGTYMQPKLIAQIGYLYNMLRHADQAPGGEAVDRLRVLKAAYAQISAQISDAETSSSD